MNICKNCRYFGKIGEHWSDMYCQHPTVERIPTVDPVTGENAFMAKNDLGRTISTRDRWPNARDINTEGLCDKYDE